ncbi:hypothetical protein Hdeb2414_s0003g00102461 [Helianthus debilis subsp. tardiflorus]
MILCSSVSRLPYRHCKARQAAVVRDKKDKQQKYGVNVKHQEYFADNPSAGLESASKDE